MNTKQNLHDEASELAAALREAIAAEMERQLAFDAERAARAAVIVPGPNSTAGGASGSSSSSP